MRTSAEIPRLSRSFAIMAMVSGRRAWAGHPATVESARAGRAPTACAASSHGDDDLHVADPKINLFCQKARNIEKSALSHADFFGNDHDRMCCGPHREKSMQQVHTHGKSGLWTSLLFASSVGVLFLGCGDSGSGQSSTPPSGGSPSGGTTATQTGGTVTATGGLPNTGGVISTGGLTPTGGVSSTGGVTSTGGVSATGGTTPTGGTTTPTGGTTRTGGTTTPTGGATGGTPGGASTSTGGSAVPGGCCGIDLSCPSGYSCAGNTDQLSSKLGRCEPTPVNGGCYNDVDCPQDGLCRSAVTCACDADCSAANQPGTCERVGEPCCHAQGDCAEGELCVGVGAFVKGRCMTAPSSNQCYTIGNCPTGHYCYGAETCHCGANCPTLPGNCRID